MRRIIPCQVFLEKYSNLCKILSKNGYLWFMKENKRWIEGARREARNDECACRRDQYLDLSRKMLSLRCRLCRRPASPNNPLTHLLEI